MVVSAPSAEIWNSLFILYSILAIIIISIVFGILFVFLVKYRGKPSVSKLSEKAKIEATAPRERTRAAIVITILLTILFTGLAVTTFGTLEFIEDIPEESDTFHVKVTAFQWGWRFTYPNGETLTGEVRVPTNTPIVFEIRSLDVFHTLGIPDFKMKKDAIPGRVNYLWFEARVGGEHTIRCYELCGVGHAKMLATLLVMEQQQFDLWYKELSKDG